MYNSHSFVDKSSKQFAGWMLRFEWGYAHSKDHVSVNHDILTLDAALLAPMHPSTISPPAANLGEKQVWSIFRPRLAHGQPRLTRPNPSNCKVKLFIKEFGHCSSKSLKRNLKNKPCSTIFNAGIAQIKARHGCNIR